MDETPTDHPDMRQRIRARSVYDLSLDYCDHAGLTWLAWPLGRMPYTDAQQIRDVVGAIVKTPKCQRTEEQCYQELRRIGNEKLQRVLDKMGVPT